MAIFIPDNIAQSMDDMKTLGERKGYHKNFQWDLHSQNKLVGTINFPFQDVDNNDLNQT